MLCSSLACSKLLSTLLRRASEAATSSHGSCSLSIALAHAMHEPVLAHLKGYREPSHAKAPLTREPPPKADACRAHRGGAGAIASTCTLLIRPRRRAISRGLAAPPRSERSRPRNSQPQRSRRMQSNATSHGVATRKSRNAQGSLRQPPQSGRLCRTAGSCSSSRPGTCR